MEINSAFIVGLILSTYMFLFCIIPYYVNNFLFKKDVKGISMFAHFGKPLYSYPLKNGIKIGFGYLPTGSSIAFDIPDDLEDKAFIRYSQKRSRTLTFVYHTILVLVFFLITLILGYNPIKIFKEILVIEYELITKKRDYNSLIPIVAKNYQMYGRILFLCFVVLVQAVIAAVLNFISSIWLYLGVISMAVWILLYFIFDLTYFMFPLSFYVDILLSMTLSGFVYFLLLRFFIK
jgi:hypothetical protein